jgi:hypothetical protein
MTSLVAWVGRDSRSLSSAYIATDSRVSWRAGELWDGGRKTFASTSFPDIFGYVGDVLMPSVVLSQFSTSLDVGLFGRSSVQERFAALVTLAKQQLGEVPLPHRHPFKIVHCARIGDGMDMTEPGGDKLADVLLVQGSGHDAVKERLTEWRNSEIGGTSRAVFGAFVSSVMGGGHPLSGGPVQLVGLHRRAHGQVFGVWHEGHRYLAGSRVPKPDPHAGVQWFNERFERCDGQTGEVIGHRQPPPRHL